MHNHQRLLFMSLALVFAWLCAWGGLVLWGQSATHTPANTRALTAILPGYVILKLKPSSAVVYVDGKRLPPAPRRAKSRGVTLAVGHHTLRVEALGHLPVTRKVRVFSADASLVQIALTPRPVQVVITSEPAGALLVITGRQLGRTPFRGAVVPRWYRAVASLSGYVDAAEDIEVKPNKSLQRFHLRLGGAMRRFQGHAMRWVKGQYYARGSHLREIKAAQQMCQKMRRAPCPSTWFTAERPQRLTWADSFWIDQYEVTNGQYRKCVSAGACAKQRLLHRAAELPVVSVAWAQAGRYCRWRKARLPREVEWELAARGPKSLSYPWGRSWRTGVANHGTYDPARQSSAPDQGDRFRFAAPVGSFAGGRSPYRVEDMAGNVGEWVADCYFTSYFRRAPERNPFHNPTQCVSRVVRGGSWMQPPWELRTTARTPLPPTTQSLTVGFRCARTAQPKRKHRARRKNAP